MENDFFLPEDWQDGKRMVEQLERMQREEVALQPTHAAQQIQYKYNQMFYIGFLFGMAMESRKEYPLEHRYSESTL